MQHVTSRSRREDWLSGLVSWQKDRLSDLRSENAVLKQKELILRRSFVQFALEYGISLEAVDIALDALDQTSTAECGREYRRSPTVETTRRS